MTVGEPVGEFYFPDRSLVSLLTVVEGHLALEVGRVGREGMVGRPHAGAACALTGTPGRA